MGTIETVASLGTIDVKATTTVLFFGFKKQIPISWISRNSCRNEVYNQKGKTWSL